MPRRPHRSRRTTAAFVLALCATSAILVPASPASAAAPDPCADVAGCVERDPVDVEGDGRADRVGVSRVGEDGDPEGVFTLTVATARGEVDSLVRNTYQWYGPVLQGYAALDSRRGKEIVIGRSFGAHTSFQRAITWRDGGLQGLRAPDSTYWVIDGAALIAKGYQRKAGDAPGLVRSRVATRADIDAPWIGVEKTHRHGTRGWRKVSEKRGRLSEKQLTYWVGWRVPGLPTGYF